MNRADGGREDEFSPYVSLMSLAVVYVFVSVSLLRQRHVVIMLIVFDQLAIE